MVAPKEPFWRCKELLHRILPGYVVKYRHHHRAGPNVLVVDGQKGGRVPSFHDLHTVGSQLERLFVCGAVRAD